MREIITEVLYPRGQRAGSKDMVLSIAPDEQREAHRRQQSQDLITP